MARDAARSVLRLGFGLMISLDCLVATLEAAPPELVEQTAPVVRRAASPSAPRVAPEEIAEDKEAPQELTPAPTETTKPSKGLEVIRERYPDGAIKIERQVTLDAQKNYLNHGPWTMWDEKQRKIGVGEFHEGLRHGTWTRWFAPGQAEMLKQPPYTLFKGPFISEATFLHGKLHGKWVIVDSQERTCSIWEFENGERHGKSTWWYPNGQKMREVDYVNGEIDGELREWSAENKLVVRQTFVQGHRRGVEVKEYSPGVKHVEAEYMYAREIKSTTYDWWNAAIKNEVLAKDGKNKRSGKMTVWYQNGRKQLEGQYEDDRPVGRFTWWHANGQKAIEGDYVDGVQTGQWNWWHANGQRQIQGEYDQGSQRGEWVWWNQEGKSTALVDFSGPSRPLNKNVPAISSLPEFGFPLENVNGKKPSAVKPPANTRR